MFLKADLGGVIEDVVVENNWFGEFSGINTLIFDDGVTRARARFNIFAQAPSWGRGRRVGSGGGRKRGRSLAVRSGRALPGERVDVGAVRAG